MKIVEYSISIGLIMGVFLFVSYLLTAFGFCQFKEFTRSDLKRRAWFHLKPVYWAGFAVSTVSYLIPQLLSMIIFSDIKQVFYILIPDVSGMKIEQINSAYTTFFQDLFQQLTTSWFLIDCLLWILCSIFIINIIKVGEHCFYIRCKDGTSVFGNLFHGFTCGSYKNVFITLVMRDLIVLLHFLLFIIPGIIKLYQYYMVDYIIAEYPEMQWKEVLRRSKTMMRGNKWPTFLFLLSFTGWIVLGLGVSFVGLEFVTQELLYVSLQGIGIIFVFPYIEASFATLYERLKENCE